jgi:hypothetical protein
VHVLLNSTCGCQFSDRSTSVAGDQSENRDDGGGLSSWRKKGLPLFPTAITAFTAAITRAYP